MPISFQADTRTHPDSGTDAIRASRKSAVQTASDVAEALRALYRVRHLSRLMMHALDFGNAQVDAATIYAVIELINHDAEKADDVLEGMDSPSRYRCA